MPRASYTAEARRDIDEISFRIAIDNPTASLRWIDQIALTGARLAGQPDMGSAYRTKRSKTLRRFPVGNYIIYYRPIADGVEVIRIVHGARDQRDLVQQTDA